MQQFEEALNIKHVKATAFYQKYNGNTERMHSTFTNMIKTSIQENNNEWNNNLKYINFAISTMKNQTTGLHYTIRIDLCQKPNMPSTIPPS